MKIFLSILVVSLSLSASPQMSKLYGLYQDGSYEKACNYGITKLRKESKNSKFVSLYAFSCLQANNISRLALPVTMLSKTEEDRKNAAFFSTILMQKSLLIASLKDGFEIHSLKLPVTDNILSKVFDLYQNIENKVVKSSYKLKNPDRPRESYKLYYKKSGDTYKIIIEEYYDTILKKRHTIN